VTDRDRAAREPKVRAATDDQARSFAHCRTFGHRWDDVGWADPLTTPPTGVARWHARGWVSRCSNCGTERTKWLTRYGTTTLNTYRHADGYLRHGEDKLSNPEWRRTWMVTMLGEDA
jgi:hypothetical protein